MRKKTLLVAVFLLLLFVGFACSLRPAQNNSPSETVYAKDNLVAWCIVPFDSKNRSPKERAEMLNKLGIKKMAYDWREQHIPTFDEEISQLKKHNIYLQGFYFFTRNTPLESDSRLDTILSVLKRNNVQTQLWCRLRDPAGLEKLTQEEKINELAKPVSYLADRAAEINCSIGLYNHGGWIGEPENMLAVLRFLKRPNVGIVYNFHHAETQIDRFASFFPEISPHVMALTLSGLKKGSPAKAVPIGQGDAEATMMKIVYESGYRGPVCVLNEYTAPDAEDGLRININGLQKILGELGLKKSLITYK